MFARVWDSIKLFLRLFSVVWSDNFYRAKIAVDCIALNKGLRSLGELEGQVSYCPRCGQRPDHDVRHDEAFELAYGKLKPPQRTKDLHFYVELANWLSD